MTKAEIKVTIDSTILYQKSISHDTEFRKAKLPIDIFNPQVEIEHGNKPNDEFVIRQNEKEVFVSKGTNKFFRLQGKEIKIYHDDTISEF